MQMKRLFKPIYILLIAALLTSMFQIPVYAKVKDQVDAPAKVTSFQTSNTFQSDNVKVTVKGKKMTIKVKTMIPAKQFRVALYQASPKLRFVNLKMYNKAQYLGRSVTGKKMYGFTRTIDFSKKKLKSGDYFLYLSASNSKKPTYENNPGYGSFYKNMAFSLKSNTPKILKYPDVIAENERVRALDGDVIHPWYLDETLSDIRFTLKNPATSTYEEMTEKKINYMRKKSDEITAGASGNYQKILKIYEYVAKNFYYDLVAFETHSDQYAHPYTNLYNQRNKIASKNSDKKGRVATTCQGFSAIFVSLARAQGIPTRFVFGHKSTPPYATWETERNIGVRDHWWVEAYVNGRWVFVDPTTGTSNKYNKQTKRWYYYGLCNYTYFDPSKEQIAMSHIYHDLYPYKRAGSMLTDPYESEKLATFLNRSYQGVKNGFRMNPDYTASDKTTWGDGTLSHFATNASGRTLQIQWSNKGFRNRLDLSGFKDLTLVSMHHNKLTSADLSDCPNLENIYLYNNRLKTIDLTNLPNLQKAVITTGNQLTDAEIYANKRNVRIHATEGGTFWLRYDKSKKQKLELTFKPDPGYRCIGIFRVDGKRVTAKEFSHAMNPILNYYEIRFEKIPEGLEILQAPEVITTPVQPISGKETEAKTEAEAATETDAEAETKAKASAKADAEAELPKKQNI